MDAFTAQALLVVIAVSLIIAIVSYLRNRDEFWLPHDRIALKVVCVITFFICIALGAFLLFIVYLVRVAFGGA